LLTVPWLFSTVGAVNARHPNDVYGQVGLVMLIGLASKNAILIVEFANQFGEKRLQALEAAQALATNSDDSFAALLGFGPVVEGAGALSRQSLVPLFSAVCFLYFPEFVYSASAVRHDWHSPRSLAATW